MSKCNEGSPPNKQLPALLQRFFLERLIQRNASPQTVASYRDSFCLLLRFAKSHSGKAPERLTLTDLDAPLILAFLNYLKLTVQQDSSCNARLLQFALSFMHFAALTEPAALPVIQRVLAIPMKRFNKPLLGFLSRDEIQTILDAPDVTTWCGHRDRVMFTVLYNTGGRVSKSQICRLPMWSSTCQAVVHIRGRTKRTLRTAVASYGHRSSEMVGTHPCRTGSAAISRLVGHTNDAPGCHGTAATCREERGNSLSTACQT